MFPDDFDVEPFNPFNVGPPNSGARSEFKIPTCVTYPPPVFVPKSKYVQPSKELVSRNSNHSIGKSTIGEVDISKGHQ
ncbi:GM19139 [Drosophila sechellia]|uniref:GM19139 n=1 Tax=Drosophila sechellia TaxID=7238 RepID=B4HX72_DROSE|nr:GM19139 [Drosophila sechellia]